VLLPLLAPALAAATLLVLVRTVGSFAVPATMGIPGGIRVLATEVFLLARQYPPRLGLAAAYAVIQVALALLALEGYRRMTRRSDRYRMVLGREPERARVGIATEAEVVLAHIALGIVTLVPLLVAVGVALAPRFGLAQVGGIEDLSLAAFREVIGSTIFQRAVRNTLVMGAWAALLTTALGLLSSRVVLRGSDRVSAAVDTLATAPLAIPGNVLGLALLWWYLILPDVGLYASRGAIVTAYVTAFLPFAHRSIHAALLTLDPSAPEASAASGAGRSRTLRRIILPMVAPGLIVGLLLVIVRAAKAIAIPALMAGPGTEVLPLLVYERFVDARYSQASAIGLLTTGLIAVSLGAALFLRRFVVGRGLSSRAVATVGSV